MTHEEAYTELNHLDDVIAAAKTAKADIRRKLGDDWNKLEAIRLFQRMPVEEQREWLDNIKAKLKDM